MVCHRNELTTNRATRFEATLAHLREHVRRHTFLEEDGRTIESADADEQVSCRTAALPGLDAFNTPDDQQPLILETHSALAPSLADEFFCVAGAAQLAAQVEALRGASVDLASPTLISLRNHTPKRGQAATPRQDGCQVAR